MSSKKLSQERRGERQKNSPSRGELDGVSLDYWLRLLEYFSGRMENRRTLEMRVFTGYIIFVLVLLKAGFDYLTGPRPYESMQTGLQVVLIGSLFLVIGFIIQVEVMHRADRREYRSIANRLTEHFYGRKYLDLREREPLLLSIFGAWAGTWTVLAAVLVVAMALWMVRGIPSHQQRPCYEIPVTSTAIEAQGGPEAGQLATPPNNSLETDACNARAAQR